jgi:hypothetical protein
LNTGFARNEDFAYWGLRVDLSRWVYVARLKDAEFKRLKGLGFKTLKILGFTGSQETRFLQIG